MIARIYKSVVGTKPEGLFHGTLFLATLNVGGAWVSGGFGLLSCLLCLGLIALYVITVRKGFYNAVEGGLFVTVLSTVLWLAVVGVHTYQSKMLLMKH